MTTKYFMGIDTGTFESKGVIIDSKGHVIAQHACAHGMENPKPNYYEHDAEEVWWHDFCTISNELIAKSGIDPEEIAAVGASALGADCLPVDEHCKPLRKAILYGIDSRATEQMSELTELYGDDQIKAWYGRPLCSSDVMPKILWIKENEPDIYNRTHKFLTGSSYITAKLCDNYVVDKFLGLASFNPLYNDDGTPNEKTCAPICRPDQLAEIHETTDIVGTVTSTAASETGLVEGTPVIAGTDDSGAEAISTGLGKLGDMMLQFGSSIYMILIADRLIDDDRIWRERFIIPGSFDVSAGTNTAGTLTRWLRDNFYKDFLEEEYKGRGNAYALMADDAQNIPVGSDGLICLPYFAGERTPINDPDARGIFFGLRLDHTRAHLYHSVLEGVAYAVNQHLKIFEENSVPVKRILAVGGGTKNPLWMQIVADVTGKEIQTSKVTIGASYGDALMAAIGIGHIKGFPALEQIIEPGTVYSPNMQKHTEYEHYQRLYDQLYDANKQLMHLLLSMI